MARIVGGCLSQFHNEPDSFELLLSYADGKEIGHVMDRGDAVKLTKSLAEELGLDTVGINAVMYLALKHLREVIAPDHVTLTGHVDFKKGAISVIDEALGRAFANPVADFAAWLNVGPDVAKAAGNVIDVRVTTPAGGKLRLQGGAVETPPQAT